MLRVLLIAAVAAVLAPATTAAAAPPGPPGPPPGAGTDLPRSPGTAPAFVPPGTAAAIPGPSGPGLLSGDRVALRRATRTFSVRLACQGDGTLRVHAARLAARSFARARYRCAAGRATARLTVSRRIAKRLARRRSVAATGLVRLGGRDARLYFDAHGGRAATAPKGFWTDGHLQCDPAFLVEPDFTAEDADPDLHARLDRLVHGAGRLALARQRRRERRALEHVDGDASPGSRSSTRTAPPCRCRGRWDRSPSPPARASTPSASTRSSTGSAAARTTSGSTSTRATTGAVAAGGATHYCVYP